MPREDAEEKRRSLRWAVLPYVFILTVRTGRADLYMDISTEFCVDTQERESRGRTQVGKVSRFTAPLPSYYNERQQIYLPVAYQPEGASSKS